MKTRTKAQLIKLIKNILNEIATTPKDNPERFKILKHKLEKYAAQYKELMA